MCWIRSSPSRMGDLSENDLSLAHQLVANLPSHDLDINVLPGDLPPMGLQNPIHLLHEIVLGLKVIEEDLANGEFDSLGRRGHFHTAIAFERRNDLPTKILHFFRLQPHTRHSASDGWGRATLAAHDNH